MTITLTLTWWQLLAVIIVMLAVVPFLVYRTVKFMTFAYLDAKRQWTFPPDIKEC